MSKSDVVAGRAYVSINVKNNMTKALNNAKQQLNDFGSSIVGIGAKVAGMGTAIVGGLAGALVHFSNVGDELDKISLRTGVSAQALAEFGFAAEQSGGTLENVESALKRMSRNLGDIGPEGVKTTAALDAIGLSSEFIASLAPEDQFQAIADGIAGIQDPTKKAAAAMAIFGEGGRMLIPMLSDMKALRKEAKDLGLSPSPESVSAAAQINDAINRVRKVISATIFDIGSAIAPMAADVLDGMLKVVSAVRRWIVQNKTLVITAAKVGAVLAVAGSAIIAFGTAFVGAGIAIGAVMSAIAAFGSAVGMAMSVIGAVGALIAAVFSPVGLLVAALIAGAYAWARFTESGRAAVSGLLGIVTETFGGISTTVMDTIGAITEAIKAGDLELAGQIAIVGLRLVFAQGLEAIAALFGETTGTMASQLLSGDFAGAWSTLGASILSSVATVAEGMINLFSGAANAVAKKWAETVNGISDAILESASNGGFMGWALEQVSGVNMQEEVARGRKIEAQRRAKGMTPDNGGDYMDSSQYQDPMVAAVQSRVADLTAQLDAAMAGMTDATGQALDDKTQGQSSAQSANIMALQAELAALRDQAAGKMKEINAGTAEGQGQRGGAGGGFDASGKASAASFSLSALSQLAGGRVETKILSAAEKTVKLNEKQVEQNAQIIAGQQAGVLAHT